LQSFDLHLFRWFHTLADRWGPLDWALSHLANDYFIPVALSLIAFSLWFVGDTKEKRRQNQWAFIYAGVGVGISDIAVKVINLHYYRDRPFVALPEILPQVEKLFYRAHDSSFPSNSATVVFALAFGVWLANKRVGTVMFVLAALMAVSRVIVGVHYPLDILGGAALGITVTFLTTSIIRLLLQPIGRLAFWILEHVFIA